MNYPKLISIALLVMGILSAMPSLAEDIGGIKAKQIAVGSSDYVQAIDASDNTLLYRRNPDTFRYDEVTSNIAVDALDVSLDGVVVALSGRKLYLWDKASESFRPQGSRTAARPGGHWRRRNLGAIRSDCVSLGRKSNIQAWIEDGGVSELNCLNNHTNF